MAPLYIAAIGEATPPLQTRRTKMTNPFSRVSENTLFSLLVVAFFGWAALTIATAPVAPSSSASSAVARVAAANSNS